MFIPWNKAVLCLDCNVISAGKCAKCGSDAGLLLCRVLDSNEKSAKLKKLLDQVVEDCSQAVDQVIDWRLR